MDAGDRRRDAPGRAHLAPRVREASRIASAIGVTVRAEASSARAASVTWRFLAQRQGA